MKRALVILPASLAEFPDWFFQPFSVSNVPSGETTHFASLIVGVVPPHGGRTLKVGPTDTLKSALSRGGFSRSGMTSTASRRSGRLAAGAVIPTVLKEVDPPEPPGLLSRVKKWFSRN